MLAEGLDVPRTDRNADVTGVMLAPFRMDVHMRETSFVVAQFHFMMAGGMLIAFLASIPFWWPKMTGQMYSGSLAKIAGVVTFVAFNITFFSEFILGYLRMPRRYHAYPPEFQVLNVLFTAGATILGIRYMMSLLYLT
jgi:cytochrome c oxidase subunit 1